MKKSMKIFSLILCLALVLTIFAACGKTEKKEDETKASTTESTTVETTTEAPKGDATHDGRLIGLWSGIEEQQILNEDGSVATTIKVRCTAEFKEDGSLVMEMNEEDFRASMVTMLLLTYGFETEEELDAFLQQNAGMSLDDMLDMAIGEMVLTITATWETDGNGNITTAYTDSTSGEEIVETGPYTLSEDGKTLVITEENEMGPTTVTYTKA